jgi:hypothetical protein
MMPSMTPVWLRRSALVLCPLIGSLACAAGPDLSTMQVDPVCHVWTTNGIMSRLSARVSQDAQLHTIMGGSPVGRWVDGENFVIEGLVSHVKGSFQGGALRIHGVFSDLKADIQPPEARIHGLFGDVTLAGNAACDARGLALGTAVIAVAIASQS